MERLEHDFWGAREVARLLALVESEKLYYQEILAGLPFPVALVSRQLQVLSANRAYREAFGTHGAALIAGLQPAANEMFDTGLEQSGSIAFAGAHVRYSLVPFSDRLSGGERCALLAAGPELPANVAFLEEAPSTAAVVDYPAPGEGGSVRWLCDRIEPRAGGGFVVMTTDETDRMLAMEVTRQQRKVEAMGRMSARLAHEYNNIMAVITGNADLLMSSTPLGHPRRAELEQILAAAERAAELGSRLRALGRPLRPKPELFDLNELLRSATAGLVLQLSPEAAYVSADRGQLAKALQVLTAWAAERVAGNSGMRMRTGSRRMEGDYTGVMRPGGYVTLEIGPLRAIPEEDRETWLEPFEMAQAAQSLILMRSHVRLEAMENGSRVVVLFPQAAKAAPKRA